MRRPEDMELLMNAALIPVLSALSTWSFISEISGLITTHVPSMNSAGSW